MVPDYERCKVRHPNHHKTELQTNLKTYLSSTIYGKKTTTEYISRLELFLNSISSKKLGLILIGSPLSGKTTLIDLAA